ncbi:MAG: adenylyl-sulfate kinase [Cyanobacteria bacterium]|nr:adenylyl-sulfate kinase [Cyanobacteriota bacterium]
MIIWITGLSGAGKSTLAKQLKVRLNQAQVHPIVLDGDCVREVIQDPHIGHDPKSRLFNAYRLCRLAKMLEEQGFWVIVATMSLFHEVQSWNRFHFKDYLEVLIQVDPVILSQRDPRNLYSRLEQGSVSNVVGYDIVAEFPLNPDIILENNSIDNLEDPDFKGFVSQICDKLSSYLLFSTNP